MPIGPELLNPIPGAHPGGQNLRYDPLYDKVKEARREEDDAPQGDWECELKRADWALVLRLCSDAIASRSKDLQLAAWATEAALRVDGFDGLRQGVELCQGLLEHFWDELYPEIEDGDLELRATPLDWIGSRLLDSLRKVPLTRSGVDWLKYRESRAVGYEADATSDAKREAREQAIKDGKMAAEEFDSAVTATPKDFYRKSLAEIDSTLESLEALQQVSETKFGTAAPSYAGIREALQELRRLISGFLAKKLEQDPDQRADDAPVVEPMQPEPEELPVAVTTSGAAAAPARARKPSVSVQPADREDACARIAAVARWLREDDPQNPVPYLMMRALRWGELRAAGTELDLGTLEAPSSEIRQRLKQLHTDGDWRALIAAVEETMELPCGRAWLDLQRYLCEACDAEGYDRVKAAIIGEAQALLAAYPALPEATLLDDTAAANPATREWLQQLKPPAAPYESGPEPHSEPQEEELGTSTVDAFELAKDAARSGRTGEAIEILTAEATHERSGRARFQRKVQLAQICLAAGYENIALPILEGLAEEIERRQLEDWESPDMLAHALALLFRSVAKLHDGGEQSQKLYSRICRLDPLQALELARS